MATDVQPHPNWLALEPLVTKHFGWAHLSAPPGQGKSTFCRWLAGRVPEQCAILLLDFSDTSEKTPGAIFQSVLYRALKHHKIEVAETKSLFEQETIGDQVAAAWTCLEAVAQDLATQDQRLLVVLDGIDMLLVTSAARRPLLDRLKANSQSETPAFDVLTTSILSFQSLKDRFLVSGLGETAERQFPPLNEGDVGFVQSALGGAAFDKIICEKLIKDTGGIIAIVRLGLDRFSNMRVGQEYDDLRDDLFEDSVDDPEFENTILGEVKKQPYTADQAKHLCDLVEILRRLKTDRGKSTFPLPPERASLAVNHGWIRTPDTAPGRLPAFVNQAADSNTLKSDAARLHKLAEELDRKEKDDARSSDPMRQRLRNAIYHKFCQSKAGVTLKATLDQESELCVVRDRHYVFRLVRNKPQQEDMSCGVATEDFMIKVFPNLPEGTSDLLEMELFLLRQLSDQKHPGLPRFDLGGRLDSMDFGQEEVGYVLMRVSGNALKDEDIKSPEKLTAAHQSDKVSEPLKRSIDELLPLAQALDRLHSLGIFHRRLILSNILRDTAVDEATGEEVQKFLLTGFEFAQYIHSFGDVALRSDEHLAEGMSEVMRARLDHVCSPPEFWSNAETDPAVPNNIPLAMSDVFGLAMLFSLMLHGSPSSENLASLLDATKPEEQLQEFEALLKQYRLDILGNEALPRDLRSILVDGLKSEASERPSARRFASVLSNLSTDMAARTRNEGKKDLLITFHEANMARELQSSRLIPMASDPNSEDAKDWARGVVKTHFSSSTHIVFDADGYSRFVHGTYRKGKEKDANIVVLSKSLAAFCAFYRYESRDRAPAIFNWALSVRRIVSRSAFGEVLLARNNVRFPNTRVKILGENEKEFQNLSAHQNPGFFKPWTPMVNAARGQTAIISERSTAHASWTFANTVLATIEELSFPVEVISSDYREATLDLDAAQFSLDREKNRYLELVYRDSEAPSQQAFFSKTVETWLEGDSGTSGQAFFIPEQETKDKESGNRIPLTINTLGHGRMIVKSHRRLFGRGKMVFSDAMTLRDERNMKSAITRDVLLSEKLFPQLDSPHPRMIISRDIKDRLKNDLPEGRSAEIVENMLNAEPFFALQGPPGTGKTTALEAYVRLSLELAPLSRLLITSQSHAAVDVVLEKVVKKLEEEENPPVIARVVPAHRPERLSPMAREYDLNDVVLRRANDMSKNAWLSAQSADIDAVGQAWQRIAKLKDTAFSEIDYRLRASVSLVFCTTSAARYHLPQVRRDSDPRFSFDVAIVEEAAKASASDLMIPLVQAPRQILIGDHKQLPAFQSQKLVSLAKMANKINEEDRLSIGLEDISFSDISRDLDRKIEWFSPFKRMFVHRKMLREEKKWDKENIKVIDTLDIQFRSHEDIGTVVSQTFYDNEIENGFWDETRHAPPLKLQRIGVVDKAINWIDTGDMETGEFVERDDGNKQLFNLGEAKVIARLVKRAGLDMDDGGGNALRERALFLSPYRRQLEAIRGQLHDHCAVEIGGHAAKDRETRLKQRLDQIVTSIDASQGSEAELVVVSLVRAGDITDEQPDPRDARPFHWERALRRNFGFLIEPERINVMLSRARTQIVIVGNLAHFLVLDKWVRAWAETHGSYYPAGDVRRDRMDQIRMAHGFWGRMIASIRDVGQIIPADKVMEND